MCGRGRTSYPLAPAATSGMFSTQLQQRAEQPPTTSRSRADGHGLVHSAREPPQFRLPGKPIEASRSPKRCGGEPTVPDPRVPVSMAPGASDLPALLCPSTRDENELRYV